jgi:hypothetical protein
VLGEELIQPNGGGIVLEDQGGPEFAFLEMEDRENSGVVDTLQNPEFSRRHST